MKTKKCSICKDDKALDQFFYDKSSKDGHMIFCKKCNTIRTREYRYKTLYGITPQIYHKMYKSQKGKCLICKKFYELLAVDHDHKTGKVRGLLCKPCNYNLGRYKEKIWVFENFIKYLSTSNIKPLIKNK